MSDEGGTGPADKPIDPLYDRNGSDLASIIASEAPDRLRTAQQLVGWTVVNRMKQYGWSHVASVWGHHNYAHNQSLTTQSLQIARDILSGKAPDISHGATHFYTPAEMPKGDKIPSGIDVNGGLEQTNGVTRNGKAVKNYRPTWAKNMQQIHTPDTPAMYFKFYR